MRPLRARLTRLIAAGAVTLGAWSAAQAQEVTVALERFGALRAFRPGDMTGIRLRLTSSRAEPVECVVAWELENADGDVVSHARAATLAPNQPLQRWLYARLPASDDATLTGQVFTVRVFESRDGARARELGALRFKASDAEQISRPVAMQEGCIALLAAGRMGLEPLEAVLDGSEVPSMDEVTRLSVAVRLDDLPDRWEGLQSASTIVWGSEAPQSLSPERATALLQWIERGGHLVIVLPESGDPWQMRAPAHLLAALLPKRGATRVDGLPIEPLLPVLTKGSSMRRSGLRMPATLFDAKSIDPGWRTLVSVPDRAAPDGTAARALVVQRPWSHGRVTLVGLDLDALHRGAAVADGAPQADVFWNRILGRRADAPTERDYAEWRETKPPSLAPQGRTSPVDVGDAGLVRGRIGQVGRASVGVLAVMAFFGAYWFAAVPGSWLLLRRRGRQAWSWPAFAVVALLATPVAWGLGLAFGGGEVQVRHLTVADFVLPSAGDTGGLRAVRANAWMSVALGGFGTSEISLEGSPGSQNLLMDWSGGRAEGGRFPDTARSERQVDEPATLRAAARATTTDLQAWWLGVPSSWGRVAWQDETRPVEFVGPQGSSRRIAVRGAIRHGLPAPMRDVQVTLVAPLRFPDRRWSKGPGSVIEPREPLPPCAARMAKVPEAWDGGPLDLGALLYPKGPEPAGAIDSSSLVREMRAKYTLPLRGAGGWTRRTMSLPEDSTMSWEDRLGALTLFQMLEPPAYRQVRPASGNASAADAGGDVPRLHRPFGRELDLSAWLTRPCVIVTGFIDGAACPLPLRIDGDEPSSDGTVMVRLILPLDAPDQGEVEPTGLP